MNIYYFLKKSLLYYRLKEKNNVSKQSKLEYNFTDIQRRKNIEFLIPTIINSFNDQNYINYEITVVDDNSTDRTAEIVYNLSVKYNNVKLIKRQDSPSLPLSIMRE